MPFFIWNTKNLSKLFCDNISKNQLIPLLHRSIAGGNFISSHEHFCKGKCDNNYFKFVANSLFNRINEISAIYI